MKNSIEEDIILLKDFTEGNFKRDKLEYYKGSYKMGYFYYKDIRQAIERVLSAYKRVLKENEELKFEERRRIIGKYGDVEIHDVINRTLSNDYISKQKIKDKIEELSKTKGDLATHIAVSERIRALQEILEESEDSKDGEG